MNTEIYKTFEELPEEIKNKYTHEIYKTYGRNLMRKIRKTDGDYIDYRKKIYSQIPPEKLPSFMSYAYTLRKKYNMNKYEALDHCLSLYKK
jgi:hypothetical protein